MLNWLGFQGDNVYGFMGMIILGIGLLTLSIYLEGKIKLICWMLFTMAGCACIVVLPALFI